MSEQNVGDATRGKGRWHWGLLVGLVAAFLVIVSYRPRGGSSQGTAHPAAGTTLPPLALQPLTGTVDRVDTQQLRGSVAVLNFWGTWCGPCRVEFPHIIALHQKYRQRDDFKLVAVSCSAGLEEQLLDLSESTVAFLEAMGAELPTYADPGGAARSALEQVNSFNGYPTTLVIDRQGVIRGVWIGYRRGYEVEVDRLVASLLVQG